MDSISTVPASAAPALRLKNFAASAAVIALACATYRVIPNHQAQLDALYGSVAFSFIGREFLLASAVGYTALFGVFYLAERDPGISKSLRFWNVAAAFIRAPAAAWRLGLKREDRVAVLATLLKAFFAPMMVMSLMVFCMRSLDNGSAIVASGVFSVGFAELFDRHGCWFLIQVILFVDVLVFTVGYLNIALLVLMAIYASASIALGFKGSNLTHRGIVARGPYALIRHPAYTCKNLAWWIGSIPLVSTAFGQSMFSGVQAVASVAGWSMVYILRALTEEDHLRSVDGEYAAYAAKVRHRFVPGIV